MNLPSPARSALGIFLTLTLLLGLAPNAQASDPCLNPELSSQPILAEGRAMPLGVYAQKFRKNVFSGNACTEISAPALYCYLNLGKRAWVEKTYSCRLLFKADHAATFELLGLPGRQSEISPELAMGQHDKLLDTYHALENKGAGTSGPARDLGNLLQRIERFDKATRGQDWQYLTGNHEWRPAETLRTLNDTDLEKTLLGGTALLTGDELRGMRAESLYESIKPFSLAILLCILGFLASISPPFGRLAGVCMVLLLIIEAFGITLRVMISGRAPITNMFETVMWVGFVILILSSLMGLRLKNKQIWAAGFAGNTITLFMMTFATGMLDGNIQPLVPVLRDNFWLSTHVTCVTSSYACFAFAWVLANYVLLRRLTGHRSSEFLDRWNYVIRITMQVGSVFLAAGVILGGVWADYSWGRFWGWDPKETWSLIALIVYLSILHGRYVGWFRGHLFTVMSALAFLSIIMAWFGVNYILAAGLHSYGFSSGGAAFITILTLTQLVIAGVSGLNERRQISSNS
ncbi:cytochrome c biogenesis protein CcsA [Bdellovibrionota bacterium FG-1]